MAEAGARELVNLYCEYKPQLFTAIASPSQKKIDKKIRAGELDPKVSIETYDGTRTFKGHIEYLKSMCEQAFTPTDTFREQITPPLAKVLEDKGVGLTPLQEVGMILGRDLVTSGIQAVKIMGMTKELTEYASDLTRQLNVNLEKKNREITEKETKIADLERKLAEMERANKDVGNPEIIANSVIADAEIISETKISGNNQEVDEGGND
jgi:hypothetical protein